MNKKHTIKSDSITQAILFAGPLNRFAFFWVLILLPFASLFSQTEKEEGIHWLQTKWAHQYNVATYDQSILNFYTENAGFLSNEQFTQNRDEVYAKIADIRNQSNVVEGLSAFKTIKDKNGNCLELGMFGTASGQDYYYITAWTKENKIALQLIDEQNISSRKIDRLEDRISVKEIDKVRQQWERYSNGHQPQQLVETVYSNDALYFNQGTQYKGTGSISEGYGYMKNMGWSITLIPQEFALVNSDMAYEIGRYVSSGEGIYILLWTRDENGSWKILFDFNF